MRVPAGPTDWSWRTRTRRPRGKSAVDSDVVDAISSTTTDRSRRPVKINYLAPGVAVLTNTPRAAVISPYARRRPGPGRGAVLERFGRSPSRGLGRGGRRPRLRAVSPLALASIASGDR